MDGTEKLTSLDDIFVDFDEAFDISKFWLTPYKFNFLSSEDMMNVESEPVPKKTTAINKFLLNKIGVSYLIEIFQALNVLF